MIVIEIIIINVIFHDSFDLFLEMPVSSSIPPPLPPRNQPDLSLNIKASDQLVTSSSNENQTPGTSSTTASGVTPTKDNKPVTQVGANSSEVGKVGNNCENMERISVDTNVPGTRELDETMSTFDRLKSRSFSPDKVRRKVSHKCEIKATENI